MLIRARSLPRRFDPKRDIPGLKLWWDFSEIPAVRAVDRSGTVKITRSWDLSGNNIYGWIEDFDPWEPIWSIDAQRGFRYAAGSTGDWRFPNWSATGITEATGIVVIKRNADPPADAEFWGYGSGATSHLPYTDGVIYDDFATDTRKTVGNPTPSMASWRIYSARSMTNLWKANLDGVELFSTTTNTVGFSAATSIWQWPDTNIAAHLVFAKYLNAGQLNAVGRYLGEKFRIPWNDASA